MIRISVYLAGLLALLATCHAIAGDLRVRLADSHGQPVADAVVTLIARDGTTNPDAGQHPLTRTIDQKALAFVPYLQVFRPGDRVVFRNSDRTRHHVYSFSPVKTFEFVLASGQSSAPLTLESSGVIAVGCNIHDGMIAYLYVSDAPWMARSDSSGNVDFARLPAGTYDVRVWQPRLRPNHPDLVQSKVVVDAAGSSTVEFALPLLPDARLRFDREHTHY